MRNEDRRCPAWNVQPGSELSLLFGLQVARIDPAGEVRPAGNFGGVVHGPVGCLGEACCRREGEMPARRESNDADSLRIDAPLLGPAPYQADGPLSILERAPGGLSLGLIAAAR